MSRDQIRMGRGTAPTSDVSENHDGSTDTGRQGHTIVGGRPAGASGNKPGIPRAMELLIKRAAIDADFRHRLLSERASLADQLAIPLDASERAMLSSIPEKQLSAIISGTRVPESQKGLLLGSPATMLLLLAQLTFGGSGVPAHAQQTGHIPPSGSQVETAIRANEQVPPAPAPRPSRESGQMMAPGGCLADEPPPRPIPAPEPSPTPVPEPTPITDAAAAQLLDRTVEQELAGATFLEAIFELQQQLGVKIKVQAPGDMGFSTPIQGPFKGLSLREVLLSLGNRAGGGNFRPMISGSAGEILLEFRPIADTIPGAQMLPPRPTVPPGSHYDGTRGIRSDMPPGNGATSKGHRADFPDEKKDPESGNR